MFSTSDSTRAGRMMAAGRVTVTFRSPKSGEHITVTAKARKKDENNKWVSCPLDEAMVVFFQVPNAGGGWDDKIGKFTKRGGLQLERSTDTARAFCAKQLIEFVAGRPLATGLEALEASRCGRCGRELTDPVSIERGIGPECYGRMTGSQHQAKGTHPVPVTDPEVHGDATSNELPGDKPEFPPTARQLVLEDAFPNDEKLQAIAGQEATYVGNHVGGRPSDNARSAVRYTRDALSSKSTAPFSSPTAVKMMETYLKETAPSYVDGGRMSRSSKAQALVDSGLADDLADARAQLEDMGE